MERRRHKTYRIASKLRFSIFIVFVICVLALGIYFVNIQGVFGSETVTYERVYVASGDTVWGIAAEHTDKSEDVRTMVRKICDANDIKNGTIYAGDLILVPMSHNLES